MSNYHKSEGGLFRNKEKDNPKKPDRTGTLAVSSEQIRGLIAMGKEGKAVKIRIAAWDRTARDTGEPFQYVTGEVFWDQLKQQSPPPPPPKTIEFNEDDIPF